MERKSRNDYFEAGLGLLAEGGAKSVTIDNLCARLRVTKGSFYHHFESGPSFMRDLLLYWEVEYSQRLGIAALAIDDPMARLGLLKTLTVELNHDAESAIRALARTDPFVAEVQRRIDTDRTRMVRRTLREAGLGRQDAERVAEVTIALLVGMQNMEHPVDRRRFRAGMDEMQRYMEIQVAEATQGSRL